MIEFISGSRSSHHGSFFHGSNLFHFRTELKGFLRQPRRTEQSNSNHTVKRDHFVASFCRFPSFVGHINMSSVTDYCSTLAQQIEENDDGLPSYFVLYQRAQLFQSQGLFLESLPVLLQAHEAVLRQKTDFVAEHLYSSISHLLANTLDYLGEHTKAEIIYLDLIHDDPKGNHICDYAVFLHRRKRDYDQAESYFRQALELYPHQSSTHLKFAGFLRHVRRNPTEANDHYIASITANPQNSDALGSYASFLHGVIGNIEEAERYYKTALQLDDTHANNLCNYGLFLSEVKQQYIGAEEKYRRALIVAPNHSNTLYNYGVMLDTHLNRKPEAESLYCRALEGEPRHPFALYNLAVLLEERYSTTTDATGRNDGKGMTSTINEENTLLQEVKSLYQRAIDADPRDPHTKADFARFLIARMNDLTAAEELLNLSLSIDPACELALRTMKTLKQRQQT